VNTANEQVLLSLPTPSVHCYSLDTVLDADQAAAFPTEFLNTIEYSGLPQNHLHLKKGAVIVLLRNLDIKRGHCNGTRYIVLDVTKRIITAKCLTKQNENEILLIPRVPTYTKDDEFPFIMKRLQFPVKVAFAITVNRAQGQSFAKCGILLPHSIWTHGQLYVALSRCSIKENIYIYADQTEFQHLHLPPGYYTRNVVYTELFN